MSDEALYLTLHIIFSVLNEDTASQYMQMIVLKTVVILKARRPLYGSDEI